MLAFTGDIMSFMINDIGVDLTPPSLQAIDAETIVLRIPSFMGQSKSVIDSLIVWHQKELSEITNLIIDIRGNSGGNDASFEKLIPYIITNKIVDDQGYIIVSDKTTEHYKNDFNDEELAQIKKLKGKLVPIGKATTSRATYLKEKTYVTVPLKESPENVAIIIDHKVGSSAEQFLYYAKQSRKVKLFGENTLGTLDCTNPEFFDGNINVTIPTMISSRFWHKAAIENIGIQPDYYLIDMKQALKETLEIIAAWNKCDVQN